MSKRKKHRHAPRGAWNEPTGYNIHHRLPKSRGGVSDPSNLSRVPIYLHHAFNALFGSNPTAQEVATILTEVWIDPAYSITVQLKDDSYTGTGIIDTMYGE